MINRDYEKVMGGKNEKLSFLTATKLWSIMGEDIILKHNRESP